MGNFTGNWLDGGHHNCKKSVSKNEKLRSRKIIMSGLETILTLV